MSHWFDRKGQPIEMMEWARKFEDRDYQVVAVHCVRGWMVSTVWLGLDHSLNPFRTGPPVIFETMIFPPADEAGGEDDEDYQERYATEEAAQAGHDRALSWVLEKLGDGAVNDVISPAQFSDPAVAPDDPSALL
jgi:hypothetical protein